VLAMKGKNKNIRNPAEELRNLRGDMKLEIT
jgi:hypothetical protein